jgi:hypothetical protein
MESPEFAERLMTPTAVNRGRGICNPPRGGFFVAGVPPLSFVKAQQQCSGRRDVRITAASKAKGREHRDAQRADLQL